MSAIAEVMEPSWKSLWIDMMFNDQVLSSATAFCVLHMEQYYLVTNRHNVTGRDNITNVILRDDGAIPNRVRISLLNNMQLDSVIYCYLDLYREDILDNSSTWFEHPILRNRVDVVVFKLGTDVRFKYCAYSLHNDFDIKIQPPDFLSVVGYPFSRAVSKYLGIWVSGFLASDMQIDFDNLPLFLIDCRTRDGMSGSPVIVCRNSGIYFDLHGKTKILAGTKYKLLGVYSGRINKNSDIGYVWKVDVVQHIIDSIVS